MTRRSRTRISLMHARSHHSLELTPFSSYMNDGQIDQLKGSFGKILNQHGHAFQASVIREFSNKNNAGTNPWAFLGSEIPVCVRGRETHVDIVFSSLRTNQDATFLIVECKRTDPALANWCFCRTGTSWQAEPHEFFQFENLSHSQGSSFIRVTSNVNYEDTVFNLGVEVPTQIRGEGNGNSKGAMSKAVHQSLLSTSGFIDHIQRQVMHLALWKSTPNLLFIPAIVTTAKLYTSNLDLGATDIASGKIDVSAASLLEVPWLWFNFNRSLELRSLSGYASDSSTKPAENMRWDFTRTIAIINSTGLDDFFSRAHLAW